MSEQKLFVPNMAVKLVNLAEIFTGNSVYILESISVGLSYSRALLEISVPGGGAGLPPPHPSWGDVRYIIMLII